MATGQVALSKHRTPVINVPKSSRTVVPAFLQKLFEMVNDPSNTDLIRWSDAGDSFFVLDHERFAREVLGRWFKHQNFSSFVRQLNMYGFHKIPHLQQGVLRSDTDTEFWNFAHPNFRRGQPDLLCLIQRKKQAAIPGDEALLDIRDTATTPTATPSVPANLSSGQLLDIQSIVHGITAIKRHQTTISAELNELKRSNQLLWQDAMDARAKHQKQQDTINRIVKFLAGVFGNRASPHKDDGVESIPSGAMIPRKGSRLLIEDGRGSEKTRVRELLHEESDEIDHMLNGPADTPISDVHYSIETPQSVPSPAPSDISTTDPATPQNHSGHRPLVSHLPQPLGIPEVIDSGESQQTSSTPHFPEPLHSNIADRAVTPSRSPTNFDYDPRVQSVINQLTPSQIQQLLTSLASQTIDPLPPTDVPPATSSQLTSYQPPFDFSQYLHPSSPSPQLPPVDGLISFDNSRPPPSNSVGSADRIDSQWKATEDINKDVNALNTSINNLIENLGLDPQLINGQSSQSDGQEDPDASVLNASHMFDEHAGSSAQDFDFDSFLKAFGNNDHVDYADSASTAFLDEVPAPSDGTVSPIAHLHAESPHAARLRKLSGNKRKSDVSDLNELSDNILSSGAKSPKRRKDK